LVPGRMEFDLVDAVSVAVVRAQDGRVVVGEPSPLLCPLRPGEHAEPVQLAQCPVGVLPPHARDEGGVGGDVVTGERRSLVEHVVGHVLPPEIWPGGLLLYLTSCA